MTNSDDLIQMRAESKIQSLQIKEITDRLSKLEEKVSELLQVKSDHEQYRKEISELSETINQLKLIVDELNKSKDDLEEKRDDVIRLEERVAGQETRMEQMADTMKELAAAQKTTTENVGKIALDTAKNSSTVKIIHKVAWVILGAVVMTTFNTWFGEGFLELLKIIKAAITGS